jgi:hypothetical protein
MRIQVKIETDKQSEVYWFEHKKFKLVLVEYVRFIKNEYNNYVRDRVFKAKETDLEKLMPSKLVLREQVYVPLKVKRAALEQLSNLIEFEA